MKLFIVVALAAVALAVPEVRSIKRGDGSTVLYASPNDRTAQCLTEPDTRLCIGNQFAGVNAAHLVGELGITHIVTAIGEPTMRIPGIDYLVLNFADYSNVDVRAQLDQSYHYIVNALASDPSARVLVHCAAGVSRSSTIVINYLIRAHRLRYAEALMRVRGVRSVVQPNYGFEQQLRQIREDSIKIEL